MADCGLKYLDELDILEEKEQLTKEQTEKEKTGGNVFGPNNALFDLLEGFDPSFFSNSLNPF
ncbi:hypothetical protein OCU04_005543 [Sclerotinia nivalis]|uniref:Uncharacterized protein n=1 Tax=Sclerotinia nivalis TaxID=352851 RepID=A0A9X0DMX4_9HELO|nr:hypothetical protein OCU04_005543 [Sclerotinia nivalis]